MSWSEYIPFVGAFLGRKKSRRELPALLERWGLEVVPQTVRGNNMGAFRGTVQGHRVEIKPDQSSMSVHVDCECEDFKFMSMAKMVGWERIDGRLGHREFEKIFQTTRLDPKVVDRLRGQTELLDSLVSLYRRPRMFTMLVSDVSLSCTVRHPSALRGVGYLPVQLAEELMAEMIARVEQLEAVLASSSSAPPSSNSAAE